jgi:hypothetical protein
LAEELADVHAAESADIASISGGDIGRDTSAPDKPERLSLRDTLNNAVSEARERERARDEQGKFAKEPKDKPAAKAVPAKEPPEGGSPTPAAQQEPVKPVGPPPGWSQASKEFFNSLPADHPLRQDIAKREEEVSNGFKSYSEKTKQYDAIEQAVAPYRTKFQQFGLKSDAEAVSRLFQWEAAIAANPRETIAQLAHQYGVDLSQFARQSPAPSEGSQEIPEHLRPVLDEFGQLKQQVNGFLTAQQQAEQARISAELSAFAKDKPHFDKVRVAMGQMMQAGLVAPNDLEGAYQRAIWADPELRESMLREQEEKRQAEYVKQQAEQAAKARLAAVSPAPRARQSAVVPQDKGSKGVRGSILAAVKEVGERDRA